MSQVDLPQALKTHQFNLSKLQEALQAKMEHVAMEVVQYLIQSFGIHFAVPIFKALKKTPKKANVSLDATYVSYHEKLKSIYVSLVKGELASLSPFASNRKITSVETPENLRKQATHFLLSNLPAPFIEAAELPSSVDFKPENYLALEASHATITATLFHILSQKADPPEATDTLLCFTTRCNAMRGIRWAYLIRAWADQTNQTEQAKALLEKHALASLVSEIEFSPEYQIPDPLDLPPSCCFQEYVCERTINLMEGTLGSRIPPSVRKYLLTQFMDSEKLRMRVVFAICPLEKFPDRDLSEDRLENPILRDMRIALNLLSASPAIPDNILQWVFLRNRDIKDDGVIVHRDSKALSSAIAHVNSLKGLYQIEAASSSHKASNSENFETHAFFLLVNFLNGQRPLNLILFLTFCSEVPEMQIETRQILPLIKKHHEDQKYEDEQQLIEKIRSHFEGFNITPSPRFFDLILSCPMGIEEVNHRLAALIENLPFDPHIPLYGEALCEALEACFTKSPDAHAFAIDFLQRCKHYRFSINQELRLFAALAGSKTTPEGKTGVSERDCFDDVLEFIKRLEHFFGRLLSRENAFQFLLFHPNMKMREEVAKNLTLLKGIRSELELVDQMIIPSKTLGEITTITGTLIFPAPTGFLPCLGEFKTRLYLNTQSNYEELKMAVMQVISQLNFSMLGVAIGPKDSDVPATPFFQSFFPTKIEDKGVIALPPNHHAYSSFEEAPFNLPQTFYYGEWQIIRGRSRFLGTLVYEGTGKAISVDALLDLPVAILAREGADFFKVLSTLYLETCNAFYRGERPYAGTPIGTLDELLEFYVGAKQAWTEYQPQEGTKADLAPAVFKFLKEMRIQTRNAVRMLSTTHIPSSFTSSFIEMAAACNLYPNSRLLSPSLLAPNIPDRLHTGFCIDEDVDKPRALFERAKIPTHEFTPVGELLAPDEKDCVKLPLKMKVVAGEHDIQIGLRAGEVDMLASYPKGEFSVQNMVWQLLMLKGRLCRSLVLKEM